MQVAIDNAKRRFDIDLTGEIKRIKDDLDIKTNKYPSFWAVIKRGFNKKNINTSLICPMNYLYNLDLSKYHSDIKTKPMEDFFVKHELDLNRKTCKKVEELIEKYAFDLFQYRQTNKTNRNYLDYLLLRSDFEELISDIQKINISRNYLGLMSWLIDRAFMITPEVRRNKNKIKHTIDKNKSILLKTLYTVNKDNFLQCFVKNTTF